MYIPVTLTTGEKLSLTLTAPMRRIFPVIHVVYIAAVNAQERSQGHM